MRRTYEVAGIKVLLNSPFILLIAGWPKSCIWILSQHSLCEIVTCVAYNG